jgi:hypothetical protein
MARYFDSEEGFYLKYHKNTYKYKDLGLYYEIMDQLGTNECFMASFEPSMMPELFK